MRTRGRRPRAGASSRSGRFPVELAELSDAPIVLRILRLDRKAVAGRGDGNQRIVDQARLADQIEAVFQTDFGKYPTGSRPVLSSRNEQPSEADKIALHARQVLARLGIHCADV